MDFLLIMCGSLLLMQSNSCNIGGTMIKLDIVYSSGLSSSYDNPRF